MVSTKANVGIGTAVVTTVGGIIIAWIMHQPASPSRLDHELVSTATPAVAVPSPPPPPAVGHVHVSDGYDFAWVYDAPVEDGTTGQIGQLSNGRQVKIVCTKDGPAQTGSNGTSTLWDKIEYNGAYGFLNDAEVNTNSNQPVAPTCT
jgi:hypothetical protein